MAKVLVVGDNVGHELRWILNDTILATCVEDRAQAAQSLLTKLERAEDITLSHIADRLRDRGDPLSMAGAIYIEELIGGIKQVLSDRKQIDVHLNDPRGDGSGDGAQPPDGDSYNSLYAVVGHLETVLRS